MEQMRIIFFFLVMLSSAAEDVIKRNFTHVRGGSVTFPDPVVLKKGVYSFKVNTIATVFKGEFRILEEIYEDRLLWNNKTGLFTLRDLQRNDSGIYKIESKDGQTVITQYKLTVYDPVSTPKVTKFNVGTETCTLLCEVQEGEEITLYWYRDTEILNQSSSALSLPLNIEDFTSSYRCVAENPVGNKTVDVNVRDLCGEQDGSNKSNLGNSRSYVIAISMVFTVVVFILALSVWCHFRRKATGETQGSEHRNFDVVYTDIHISEDRRRQERNHLDSPEAAEGSRLASVYDKIQPHRIIPAETEADACLYSKITNVPHA